MTQIEKSYTGMTVLFDINADRIVAALAIAVILASFAWLGFEYVSGHSVQLTPGVTTTAIL